MAERMPPPAFYPGSPPANPGALARYLPPLPGGAAAAWLQAMGIQPGIPWQSGGGILDPFGAAPQVVLELARAGYPVLVAANNPISRFLIELRAGPPGESELRAAIANLAAVRRGDQRLEPHIRSLYQTSCDRCGRTVEAEAFLWDRESSLPYARLIHCSACGLEGEHPASQQDIQNALRFAEDRLHRARALERVAPLNDPDRENVEEALQVYLPRAVYALFTMINKLEAIPARPAERKLLVALLLSTCDQASALWPHPSGRPRPRQLLAPPRYRENNLWMALENSQREWLADAAQAPVCAWPELPVPGGISIFEGRLKDLQEQLQGHSPAAAVAALPRPNQAFWTLSALWSGWLWGREALGHFRSVLRRRRYDWNWHAAALASGFHSLADSLPAGTPMLGLIGEAEPGFISAALLGAEAAGLALEGVALRADAAQAQITWRRSARRVPEIQSSEEAGQPASSQVQRMAERAANAARDYLLLRSEPASYLQLHTAALADLVRELDLFTPQADQPRRIFPGQMVSAINQAFEQAFTYRSGLLRYGGSEKSLEVGYWWLRDWSPQGYGKTAGPGQGRPLADQVEIELVRYLVKCQVCQQEDIDQHLCRFFPGTLTPNDELLAVLLRSYAAFTPESQQWRLRTEDQPEARRKDVQRIQQQLQSLGKQLGFQVSGVRPLLWTRPNGAAYAAFYVLASAVFADLVYLSSQRAERFFLVLPGGRAELALYKMKHNAHLAQAVKAGWRFVKFRHVQHLGNANLQTAAHFEEQVELDPLQDTSPQLRMF